MCLPGCVEIDGIRLPSRRLRYCTVTFPGCTARRSDYAATLPLLVLDGRIGKKLSAKEHGGIQSADPLCGALPGQILPAGWTVLNWIYQRFDEQEYDSLVPGPFALGNEKETCAKLRTKWSKNDGFDIVFEIVLCYHKQEWDQQKNRSGI